MAIALICLTDPIDAGLDWTLLWRDDVERHVVADTSEARRVIATLHPAILVVDRDLAGTEDLIRDTRANGRMRAISIVVAARGDMRASEITLLEAGANAILRLPAGPAWDERLARLARVPVRKALRMRAHLQLEGRTLLDLVSADGTILNLSTAGMLLDCGRPLELGSELSFSFQLPESGAPITGRGRVVRLAGAGSFGVEFTELCPGAVEQIDRLRG
jgi:DNA-binding response OmpR family regulator